MKTTIEAVTVCVDYADELSKVASHNRPHLDRWIVVTRPSDEETRSICRRFSIECITTDDFDRRPPFAKAMGIERGLAHLRGDGWILHLDADIALPVDFDVVLQDAHLDESCIYGCDRLNVITPEAWKRVEARGLLCRSGVWAVDLDRPDCRIGTRVANLGHGWSPIGFFQLWSGVDSAWRSFPAKRYPQHHGTAARTDVQHSLQWDRRKRVLIPELVVWHYEPEKVQMGANWAGKKKQQEAFGGSYR